MKFMRKVKDFLYPSVCISCHDVMRKNSNGVMCGVCKRKWLIAKQAVRLFLRGFPAIPFEIEDAGYNSESFIASVVNYRSMTIEEGFAVQKRVIFELKRHGFKRLVDFLSDELYDLILETMPDTRDFSNFVIVSIPRHPKNYIFGAHDGVRDIGVSLAERMNCIYLPALSKPLFAKEQKNLDYLERISNNEIFVKKDYRKKLYKKRVIIIDDVVTTGASVKSAASDIMKSCRAKSVYVYSLAQSSDLLFRDL